MKQTPSKRSYLLLAGILLAAILIAVLTSSKPKAASDRATAAELQAGRSYLEALSRKDPALVDAALKERDEAKRARDRADLLDELCQDEANVWSLFDNYVLMGEALGSGFSVYGFFSEDRVLAGSSYTLRNVATSLDKAAALKPGQVMVLQNLRFHAEEEKNDPEFAKALASMAEIYVNDAFGTAHRAHASTEGVTHYLPAVCGFLIEKELRIMGKALENADRPFVAVLGGAKIEDKLNVINNLLEKVDTLIIGGGMAFTFLKAKGYEVGESLLDESKIDYCKDMMKKAEEKGVKLLLPIDSVCVKEFPNPIDAPIDTLVVDSDKIPADMQGCDIGPKTVELFGAAVKAAKTVVWNGPMGVFENPTLAKGTLGVAQAMADSDAVTIIGGGDSAAAVQQMGLAAKMTHISTGGGASLEYLEGKTLPGVAALNDK